MQAFLQGGALVGEVLERPRWRHWAAEMNPAGGWQWLGIRHCRPKSREIISVAHLPRKL
jgi:hypothetical protein